MAELDSLIVSEKEMTEQQKDARRREYSQKMAEAAAAMDNAVDAIIASLPRLNLDETERAAFLALADRLRGKSREILDLASDNRSRAIPDTLAQMETTCAACHQLFRGSKP